MQSCKLLFLFFSFRIRSNPGVEETRVVQTLSQSLPIPTISVTSEPAELTPVTHLQAETAPIEKKSLLSLPSTRAQEFEQENVVEKNKNLWLGSSSITLTVPSSPKLLSSHGSPLGSPTLQRCKSFTKLASYAVNADISNVPKVQSPKLKRADARTAVVDQSNGKMQTENLTRKEITQGIILKEIEAASINRTLIVPEFLSSPKLPSNRNSPFLQRRRTSPCLNKTPSNATNTSKSQVFTIPRSPKLERPHGKAAIANQSGGKTKKAWQTENLKMQTLETEIIPKGEETSCIESAKVFLTTPSSPKLPSSRPSPGLRRGRSLSCLNKVPNDANDYENSNVFSARRSPKLIRAEANALTADACGKEPKVLQAEKDGCRGSKMVNKGRSLSTPLPQKPEKEHSTLNRKDSGIETDLHEDQDSGQKTGFADIRNHVSIPLNQFQPKQLLSLDHSPLQRSRSTEDIKEALRACKEESQPGWQSPQKIENAENKLPCESSEQTFLAKGINSPRMVRRLGARSRASTMPRLLEATEEKSYTNVMAFNLAAQHTAGVKKPVKFREITEPLKKSKWFHALSTIVSLGHFQTAMLEIQKQKELEKALEEKQPSVATSFQEIKNCRYLRMPEHYQSNK